jgi:hypothetical protein
MDIDKVVALNFAEGKFSVTIHVAADAEGLVSGAQVFQPKTREVQDLTPARLARILAEVSALQSAMLEQLIACLPESCREDFLREVEEIASVRHAQLKKSGTVSVTVVEEKPRT